MGFEAGNEKEKPKELMFWISGGRESSRADQSSVAESSVPCGTEADRGHGEVDGGRRSEGAGGKGGW